MVDERKWWKVLLPKVELGACCGLSGQKQHRCQPNDGDEAVDEYGCRLWDHDDLDRFDGGRKNEAADVKDLVIDWMSWSQHLGSQTYSLTAFCCHLHHSDSYRSTRNAELHLGKSACFDQLVFEAYQNCG